MAMLDDKGALVRTKSPDADAADAPDAADGAAPGASPSERALPRPALGRAVNLSASDPALAAVRAAVPGERAEQGSAPARPRLGATVVTAVLATLTGVAVTLGVVYASGRKDDGGAHGIAASSSAPTGTAPASADRDRDRPSPATSGGAASPASTLSTLAPLSPLGSSSAAASGASGAPVTAPASGSPPASPPTHAPPSGPSKPHGHALPALPSSSGSRPSSSGGAPPRATTKPLDINRDLP
jgi:hypothetical protein